MPMALTCNLRLRDGDWAMKLRVRLFAKDRPKAEQSPHPVTIEGVPTDARHFDHQGKRYKITWRQTSVHEVHRVGPRPMLWDASSHPLRTLLCVTMRSLCTRSKRQRTGGYIFPVSKGSRGCLTKRIG